MLKQLTQRLFANKFLLTAVSISTTILFFILIISSRHSTPTPTTPPDSIQSKSTSPFSEFTNLTEEKVKNATNYRNLVSDRFPMYLKDFKTSVGITTTINIHYLKDDDPSLMRLEIYGLSYINKDELDEKKNPNVTAFKESFIKALSLIREAGVDPNQLIFIYGDRADVRATATHWVEQLMLLK